MSATAIDTIQKDDTPSTSNKEVVATPNDPTSPTDPDPDVVAHGEDSATLQLVATLAGEEMGTPKRVLRKRNSMEVGDDSPAKGLRLRKRKSVEVVDMDDSPARRLRRRKEESEDVLGSTPRSFRERETPKKGRVGVDVDLDMEDEEEEEEEVEEIEEGEDGEGEEDAEGEEYWGEDAEGSEEEEYVEE